MDFDVVRIDETRCSLDLRRDGKVEPVKLPRRTPITRHGRRQSVVA